jgi:hypothetical protein
MSVEGWVRQVAFGIQSGILLRAEAYIDSVARRDIFNVPCDEKLDQAVVL